MLAQLLNEKYPTFDWERVFLLKGRYAQQKRLERAIISLFPVHISPSLFLERELIFNNIGKGN